MTRRVKAVMSLGLFGLLVLAWQAGGPLPSAPPGAPAEARSDRTVYLAGGLAPEQLISLSANLAASGRPGLLLLDTPRAEPWNRKFLREFAAAPVIPVGEFADPEGLGERLGRPVGTPVAWRRGPDAVGWTDWFPQAGRVVVCPAEPRGQLLQTACLAGAAGVPLVVTAGGQDEPARLRKRLADWKAREVVLVGAARSLELPADLRRTELADADAVAAAHRKELRKRGPIESLVLANPADGLIEGDPGLSALAPWVALRHRAALLLTDAPGTDASQLLKEAAAGPDLKAVESVILVASHRAIPVEKRPNPVPGKDEFIEMEPGTPTDLNTPFTFAVGRMFHADLGLALLQTARPRLWPAGPSERKVLLASNPGGGLPLLETFSRNTAREFRNRGYQTMAMFENDVTRPEVQRLLPQADVFLWEGHHMTLVRDFESTAWTEPLRPGLVFLQSCLALNEPEALPLLERGAVATVGSSTRTYSGSGGAFTLAFFDAMMYEDRTLGGSLRSAKNFLNCYSQLKKQRLGEAAKLSGVNVRSAWAFTLWGDPTLKLPKPTTPDDSLPPLRTQVVKNTIVMTLPEQSYPPVDRPPFKSQLMPNARMAGLLTRDDEDDRHLVPFLFAEVALPKVPDGKTPALKSALPSARYVFSWDARRKTGYLLAMPRAKDTVELRFNVSWEE
jgi:hypothetical protein